MVLHGHKILDIRDMVKPAKMDDLIIRPGALGDTLMALPALRDMSGKTIVIFVGRQPGLVFIQGLVSRAMDFEAAGWHRLFMKGADKYGLPILQADRVVAFFGKQKERIRRNLRTFFPNSPIHIFSPLPPQGRGIHTAQYMAECLKAAGFPVAPKRAMERARREALVRRSNASVGPHDTMLFHPGSGDSKKNLPADFWLELKEKMCRAAGFQDLRPIFLLGPAETQVYNFLEENLRNGDARLYFSPDKDRLVSLLSQARLYVGHDSGITHLAALCGTRVVALFKESDADMWMPLGPYVRIVRSEASVSNPTIIEMVLEASRALLNG